MPGPAAPLPIVPLPIMPGPAVPLPIIGPCIKPGPHGVPDGVEPGVVGALCARAAPNVPMVIAPARSAPPKSASARFRIILPPSSSPSCRDRLVIAAAIASSQGLLRFVVLCPVDLSLRVAPLQDRQRILLASRTGSATEEGTHAPDRQGDHDHPEHHPDHHAGRAEQPHPSQAAISHHVFASS